MKIVKIDLENCYGIRALKADFDFSQKNLFVVYAPNGAMKSSLAKTFKDLSEDSPSEDRIFKARKNKRIVVDGKGVNISKEQVFVIEPINEAFKSNKISTLLVNKALKEKYDSIYETIGDKKEALVKTLKSISGLKNGVEETLTQDIIQVPKEFYVALASLEEEILQGKENSFSDIPYQNIFNEKVTALLEEKDFKEKLANYIKTYDQLVSTSTFFKKGVFNHNNASDISKNLKENSFFKASHSIIISTKGAKTELRDASELDKVIQKEKEEILRDATLVKSFEEIDKKLTKNKELKEFRDCVERNSGILLELVNPGMLRRKLWINYLVKAVDAYKALMEVYKKSKKDIEQIITQAKKEETKWKRVIEIFNERFLVPFIVVMDNQADVILNSEAPSIKFRFKDFENNTDVPVEENDLWRVLSSGEKRALYLLNIIFEVEARKEDKQETLFIIDDIADSFDYKNKYAIIEYLNDILKVNYFYQIVLTHNFDFFRNLSSRLKASGDQKRHIIKTKTAIWLLPEKYSVNPFKDWKKHLHENDEMLIAAIPFLRNLAEFCGFPKHYDILTKLLHLRPETYAITIGDVEQIIKDVLKDMGTLSLSNHDKIVKDLIFDVASRICLEADEIIDLEKKIVLSIAIRLKTEEYLIKEINDPGFVSGIIRNQTIDLINKFKEQFPTGKEDIVKLAERVNLMTPENIHINSFMYEPILDMSSHHLRELYRDACLI